MTEAVHTPWDWKTWLVLERRESPGSGVVFESLGVYGRGLFF